MSSSSVLIGPGQHGGDQNDLTLNPSTRVLWRSPDSVQLELGSRAVVVDGIGTPTLTALTQPLASTPPDAPGLAAALRTLAASDFVWRRSPGPRPPVGPAQPHLAGDLAALRSRHGARAERVLSERADAGVVVHGVGRLAVNVACLLAAANVGRIHLQDSGEVHRHDSAPGGLRAEDEGRRFADAAHDAIRRAAPAVDTTALDPTERADLAIIVGEAPIEDELRTALHADGIAHLGVRTGADECVVGPLVLPGLTSCLGCADQTRLDRDPAWSMLAIQLSIPRRHAGPSDIALTMLTASLAALQALAYLDGDEPATLSGTLELRPPDWRLRRRSWAPHPRCDCGAVGEPITE